MDRFSRVGKISENTRSAGLEKSIRKSVDLSGPLLDGVGIAPFVAIFVEGLTFLNERNIYGRVILQASCEEVDTVVDARRRLDEIVEATVDLAKKTISKRFSWNLRGCWSWSRPTCFILRMSRAGVYASTLSRSSGGSLSMGCGTPVLVIGGDRGGKPKDGIRVR